MAVDIDSSFCENRVINVPVGRILCSRKWMNSHLVATMKGYIDNLRIINNSRSRAQCSPVSAFLTVLMKA